VVSGRSGWLGHACALRLGSIAVLTGGVRARHLAPVQVRPGLVGEAVTVFEGVKPEAFKVRVLSVVPNFLPKQDIILIRAEDPRVATCGIAAGMSGSPVYVDGKLMGAIAYGWSFAKEALAGVTPSKACWPGGSGPVGRRAIPSWPTAHPP